MVVAAGSRESAPLEQIHCAPEASPPAGCPDRPSLHLREPNSSMKNRKRESCTSGAVRDEDGNILIYSACFDAASWLTTRRPFARPALRGPQNEPECALRRIRCSPDTSPGPSRGRWRDPGRIGQRDPTKTSLGLIGETHPRCFCFQATLFITAAGPTFASQRHFSAPRTNVPMAFLEDRRKCQTATVIPAEPGGFSMFSMGLSH